jgi:hypothetical protein
MKKLFSILLVLVIMSVPAFSVDFFNVNLDTLKTEFNQQETPWIIETVLGTENINIEVTGDTPLEMNIQTEDGKIKSIGTEKSANPTLTIEIPEDKIEEIMNSGNPMGGLIDVIKNKEVKVEGTNWLINLKIFILDIILAITGFVTTIGNYVIPLA